MDNLHYGVTRDARIARCRGRHERAAHDSGPGRISFVEVGGDRASLEASVGGVDVDPALTEAVRVRASGRPRLVELWD